MLREKYSIDVSWGKILRIESWYCLSGLLRSTAKLFFVFFSRERFQVRFGQIKEIGVSLGDVYRFTRKLCSDVNRLETFWINKIYYISIWFFNGFSSFDTFCASVWIYMLSDHVINLQMSKSLCNWIFYSVLIIFRYS